LSVHPKDTDGEAEMTGPWGRNTRRLRLTAPRSRGSAELWHALLTAVLVAAGLWLIVISGVLF